MKDYLRYNWWKYLCIIAASTLLWCTVFSAIAQPRSDERVNVLFIGTRLDTPALKDEIVAALPELSNQPIESVRVDLTLPDIIPYAMLLSTRVMEYDIIIIEEPYLREYTGQQHFSPSSEQLQSCFPNAQPYYEEADGYTLIFGYVLYDTQQQNIFSEHYSGENRCYLFVSPESVNFDTLNGEGEPGNDAALKVAQYLMGTGAE